MIIKININEKLPWIDLENIKNKTKMFLIENYENIEIVSTLIHNENFDLIIKTKEELKIEKKEKKNKIESPLKSSYSISLKYNSNKEIDTDEIENFLISFASNIEYITLIKD